MSDHNKVHLHGTFSVTRSGAASGSKQAYVKGRIKPPDGKASFDVLAFGATAEALGNAHELTVSLEGQLKPDKPSPEMEKKLADAGIKLPWPLIVVAEKVTEHAPRGHAQEDGNPF